MEKYLNFLKENGADVAIVIDPASVITAPWTVYICKFSCPAYDTNHYCPPRAPSWKETQEILDCYKTAILFRTHELNTITALAVKAQRELFLDGYYKSIAFGSGGCDKCAKCNPDHCNQAGTMVPSMEACGIDVFGTVRANGLEIRTLREKGEEMNHYGLLLVE